MSSRLAILTERRQALQDICALQREEAVLIRGSIEDRTARIDRAFETMRGLAPLIAAGGLVLVIALGPGRALRLLRRGLAFAVVANQTLRMLR